MLKPGGALFLIGHNRRAFSAKVLGRKSPIFDIEHLQLFSPVSVRHLLERAGFSRVEVRPVFNRYPLRYRAPLPFSSRLQATDPEGLAVDAHGSLGYSLARGESGGDRVP